MSKDWPQESELRAMPLLDRLRHASNAALVEDRESIELAMDRIAELEAENSYVRAAIASYVASGFDPSSMGRTLDDIRWHLQESEKK